MVKSYSWDNGQTWYGAEGNEIPQPDRDGIMENHSALRAENKRLQTSCASMREALQAMLDCCNDCTSLKCAEAMANAALSTTAGAAMLRVVEAARKAVNMMVDDDHLAYMEALEDALAGLDVHHG